jgi:hypothetical protein
MADDTNNTPSPSYRYAERRIVDLLNRLGSKGVCRCCTSRAMVMHAVMLCETTLGSKFTAELFSDLVESVRENNIPAPDHEARH